MPPPPLPWECPCPLCPCPPWEWPWLPWPWPWPPWPCSLWEWPWCEWPWSWDEQLLPPWEWAWLKAQIPTRLTSRPPTDTGCRRQKQHAELIQGHRCYGGPRAVCNMHPARNLCSRARHNTMKSITVFLSFPIRQSAVTWKQTQVKATSEVVSGCQAVTISVVWVEVFSIITYFLDLPDKFYRYVKKGAFLHEMCVRTICKFCGVVCFHYPKYFQQH